MDEKERSKKIGQIILDGITCLGKIIWAFIRGIATIITLFIIFILIMTLLPFPFFGLAALMLLLSLLIIHREKVSTVIAFLIAIVLTLTLAHNIKYYYYGNWNWTNKKWLNIHFTGNHFGLVDAKNTSYDTLTCYGAAYLDEVTIAGPLIVYGKLYANELMAQDIVTVYGQTFLDDSVIKGPVCAHGNLHMNKCSITKKLSVYGTLEAKECHLDEIEFYAKKLKLKTSHVKNIYAKESRGRTTIVLTETTVDENVTFEDGNGKVILKKGASIKGKVSGGTVVIE